MRLLTITTVCVCLFAASPAAPLAAGGAQNQKADAAATAPVKDPVCGMSVDAAKAKSAGRTSEYEGKTFYFCNDECKKRFDAAPAKFTAPAKTEAGATSTCCCNHEAESKGCCKTGGGMSGMRHGAH